jgi:hypothetical protein
MVLYVFIVNKGHVLIVTMCRLNGLHMTGPRYRTCRQVPPIVEAEKHLWQSNVPMILYFVVEHHLPQRVMKQFGRKQDFPLQHESTSRELHE